MEKLDPCVYDNLLDRIQRLEQYLAKPCQQCQFLNVPMFNSNNNASDHPESPSQPIIMQGYIQNQPVTLFNRPAVELVNRLHHIHDRRLVIVSEDRNLSIRVNLSHLATLWRNPTRTSKAHYRIEMNIYQK